MNIPQLNVKNTSEPSGFRNNAHPSSARGANAGRNNYFAKAPTKVTHRGRSQTERLARSQALTKQEQIMKEARARVTKSATVTKQREFKV